MIRDTLCYEISRRLIRNTESRSSSWNAYDDWRQDSLAKSWIKGGFSDADITGKDVIDFGCGMGSLTQFLAMKSPRTIVGVDLRHIEDLREKFSRLKFPPGVNVEFKLGDVRGLPFEPASFDTLLAFDCLEHVMAPLEVLQDWGRVLRPGGKALIEWYPFRGPWGPHMESLIPIPWAQVLFGEAAMFSAAERIYDRQDFSPRVWDLDPQGQKLPNKWRAWRSFKEQGYVNELDVSTFRRLATDAGFRIGRFETFSFSSGLKQKVGNLLMQVPRLGEYFAMYVVVELVRI